MHLSRASLFFHVILSLLVITSMTACGEKVQPEAKFPTGADRGAAENDIYAEPDSIFGPDGLSIFGGNDKNKSGEAGIGVNGYLWRAALDTISFMPLESADPFGGTILTDWYVAPESPNERLKLNVFILDKQLRSDALRVRVFRQVRSGGTWRDAAADPETGPKLEDAILTRARQLRIAGLNN